MNSKLNLDPVFEKIIREQSNFMNPEVELTEEILSFRSNITINSKDDIKSLEGLQYFATNNIFKNIEIITDNVNFQYIRDLLLKLKWSEQKYITITTKINEFGNVTSQHMYFDSNK